MFSTLIFTGFLFRIFKDIHGYIAEYVWNYNRYGFFYEKGKFVKEYMRVGKICFLKYLSSCIVGILCFIYNLCSLYIRIPICLSINF